MLRIYLPHMLKAGDLTDQLLRNHFTACSERAPAGKVHERAPAGNDQTKKPTFGELFCLVTSRRIELRFPG